MRVHTLRGRVSSESTKRLILDDGRFNHAMVVKEFYVFPIDAIEDPRCVLAKQEEEIGTQFDAGNGNQIAWGAVAQSNSNADWNSIIDPEHVIVRDLFIKNISLLDANYLVVLEAKTISDDEAILQLIKESNQDVN